MARQRTDLSNLEHVFHMPRKFLVNCKQRTVIPELISNPDLTLSLEMTMTVGDLVTRLSLHLLWGAGCGSQRHLDMLTCEVVLKKTKTPKTPLKTLILENEESNPKPQFG